MVEYKTKRIRALMRAVYRALVNGIILLWLAGEPTRAGSLVEFDNVSEYAKPARLAGYLAQPDGVGPFPAVVVLHGCGGISSHSIGIADQLSFSGYVGLAVDSLGPRGMADACGEFFIGQATDAYAAARFLAHQPLVDPNRIALLGQSMGGSSALMAVERGSIERRFPERFAAAIAYYPSCRDHPATLTAPSLILIGEADDLNTAEPCRDMTAQPHPDGATLDLVVYPGAYHAFDVDWFQQGRNVRGHWFEYNPAAANDARERVRVFLARSMGGSTIDPAGRRR
jgi:dienelactone hydrolase